MTRADFRTVSELPEEGTSVHDYDFVMSSRGNRCEFRVRPGKARWQLEATLARAVQEAGDPFKWDFGWSLDEKLGKPTTLDEWKALLTEEAKPFLDDVEDL